MYNSQEIANKIKETAGKQNKALGIMFNELQISNNTLHNMKTSIPKADTLAKIADYLDCSVDYLLGRDIKKGASVMLALGIPDKYAMERGGWSSPHIMKSVYQHTFSAERKAADQKVDDFFTALLDTNLVTKKD